VVVVRNKSAAGNWRFRFLIMQVHSKNISYRMPQLLLLMRIISLPSLSHIVLLLLKILLLWVGIQHRVAVINPNIEDIAIKRVLVVGGEADVLEVAVSKCVIIKYKTIK
jgi:hypothetical protein